MLRHIHKLCIFLWARFLLPLSQLLCSTRIQVEESINNQWDEERLAEDAQHHRSEYERSYCVFWSYGARKPESMLTKTQHDARVTVFPISLNTSVELTFPVMHNKIQQTSFNLNVYHNPVSATDTLHSCRMTGKTSSHHVFLSPKLILASLHEMIWRKTVEKNVFFRCFCVCELLLTCTTYRKHLK